MQQPAQRCLPSPEVQRLFPSGTCELASFILMTEHLLLLWRSRASSSCTSQLLVAVDGPGHIACLALCHLPQFLSAQNQAREGRVVRVEIDQMYAPAESRSPMFSTSVPSETATFIPHSNLLLALVWWSLEFPLGLSQIS